MKITFTSKEKTNAEREEAFLKLTPSERVVSFLKLMKRIKKFPTHQNKENSNFLIVINRP